MEMLLTPTDWLHPAGESSLAARPARSLDWQALAARLAAAAACREAVGAVPARFANPGVNSGATPSGSFDPASARQLAGFHAWFAGLSAEATLAHGGLVPSRAVNRTDSVECKPEPAIPCGTAGMVKTGDRGLK